MLLLFKMINLGLRFSLEVTALSVFCYWGIQTGKNGFMKVVLGIGSPLIIASIWGIFGSPAAPYPLSGALKIVLEQAIFIVAAIALYSLGKIHSATVFIILTVINRVLLILWEQ